MRARYVGLFALSAAALMYELALTRLFAVAQGYHFAFLSLSLALLGFGASGAWLARWSGKKVEATLAPVAGAMGMAIVGSYLVLNWLPFDAYSLAWDGRQLLLLALDYLALVVPFLLAGLATGLTLSAWPESTPQLYATNLAGSAAGSLAVLGTLGACGGTGTVMAAAAAAWIAAGAFARRPARRPGLLAWGFWAGILMGLGALAVRAPAALDVRLSPYKPLSYVLRYPGAHVAYQRWNAYSRLDVVESQGIHSAPGLSLRYTGLPPEQWALALDGGDLSPITHSPSPGESDFLAALQGGLPYRLRPQARVLLLDPRGGLDLLLALRSGAQHVEVVMPNPLVLGAVRDRYGDHAGRIYQDQRVRVHVEGPRSFLARDAGRYDLLVYSLTQAYRPVTAGSYALGEDYTYTVDAFQAGLRRLAPEGMLVAQGWLQAPPSETVRLIALATEALARLGVADPRDYVVAYRDWALVTLLVKRTPFAGAELAQIRKACEANGFDLVVAPGLQPEETNRYHVLPVPAAGDPHQRMLNPAERADLIEHYPYDVSPTGDERPFFRHTFRWQQLPAVWQRLGRSVEPFGGGGYLVLLGLLGLTLLISAGVVGYTAGRAGRQAPAPPALAYFLLVGAGYMTVELVLMQRAILLLDQPTYAFASVLATLLVSSGAGSALAPRLPLGLVLPLLALGIGALAWGWPAAAAVLLGAPMGLRLAAVVALVAPLGVLMGVPFPSGMARLVGKEPRAIAAAWAINGCASVLASILEALAVLALGFAWVLAAGGLCYLMAWTAMRSVLARERDKDHARDLA